MGETDPILRGRARRGAVQADRPGIGGAKSNGCSAKERTRSRARVCGGVLRGGAKGAQGTRDGRGASHDRGARISACPSLARLVCTIYSLSRYQRKRQHHVEAAARQGVCDVRVLNAKHLHPPLANEDEEGDDREKELDEDVEGEKQEN